MYFGSDESLAGQSAGQRLAKESRRAARPCAVHEQGNISLETRCAGVKQGLPNTENLQVNGQDLPRCSRPSRPSSPRTRRSPTSSPSTQASPAPPQAQTAAGTHAKIVTFDLSPDVVQAIKDKKIEFSVDQQPYLQAYEAVDSLWLYLTNGNGSAAASRC